MLKRSSKKTILFLLSVILCIALLPSVSVYGFNADARSNMDVYGVAMTTDDFTNAFTGEPQTRSSARSSLYTGLSFSNVVINDDNIRFTAELTLGTEVTVLDVHGYIFAGNRTLNNVIIDVPEAVNGYEFLLIEIHTDYSVGSLLLSDSLNTSLYNRPHMKVYLIDSHGLIRLFEMDVPHYFSGISACSFSQLEGYGDIAWAFGFVDIVVHEVPTDQSILEELGLLEAVVLQDFQEDMSAIAGISPLSISSGLWVYPTTFTTTFWIGPDRNDAFSLPHVRHSHPSNIAGNASHTWSASFNVAEHVRVTGASGQSINFHGLRVFEYRNVALHFGGGAHTVFSRAFHSGNMLQLSSGVNHSGIFNVALSVFSGAVGSLPGGQTVSSIVSNLQSVRPVSRNIIVGSSAIEHLAPSHVRSIGYRFDGMTFHRNTDSNGHFYSIQLVAEGYGNLPHVPTLTTGVLRVEFDVYQFQNRTFANRNANIHLNYHVRW